MPVDELAVCACVEQEVCAGVVVIIDVIIIIILIIVVVGVLSPVGMAVVYVETLYLGPVEPAELGGALVQLGVCERVLGDVVGILAQGPVVGSAGSGDTYVREGFLEGHRS